MDIKTKISEYIKNNKEASYVEIEDIFKENGFNYEGNLSICSAEYKNIVFWASWNQEAIDIVNSLKKSGLIKVEPVNSFVYFMSGKSLNLPLVKTKTQYKEPHWLPTVFSANS